MARILIADDNRTTTRTLASLVERWGHQARQAFDGAEALAVLQAEAVDVLITDLRMPAMDGMQLLRSVRERWPDIVVVVVTAYGTIQTAVEAIQVGAFDFLTKPYDNDELRTRIERALAQRDLVVRMERVDARLASLESEGRRGEGDIIGDGPAMRAVFAQIHKVAATPSTVLLLGESGTGKELAARAIHQHSPRQAGPFVAVHCAAYAEGLLESELFGHEKGAFTGAHQRKVGRLELADGGTLFLDEVGEIPLSIQVKLLRVLQEREFERVGGTHTLHFDTRIVAATNRDLPAAIAAGRFREDLFYRLNVFTLTLPPLRQRLEDLPALIEAFCARQGQLRGQPIAGLTERALRALMAYDWPGNVRELQNVLERAAILAGEAPVDLEHLPVGMAPRSSPQVALPDRDMCFDQELEEFERRLILHAYERCQRVKAATARMLGIDRNRLRYKLKKFGIED